MQQGVASIEGPNLVIEGSAAMDKTWFVAKMEMSGADGIPQLYIWKNPDPDTEPDIENADISVAWPNGASIAYDHIRLSSSWEDIPYGDVEEK